jgi:2-hydroxychromene-2-carboxylate isomerase
VTQEFKEQGGASTMDPSWLRRWITSKLMTTMSSESRLIKQRQKYETKRAKANEPHIVEYFHQVEDGYSHFTAQILERFSKRYKVELACHLVSGVMDANAPEPDLLLKLSRYDSYQIAPHYGLEFAEHEAPLGLDLVQQASNILASLDDTQFVESVAKISAALWGGSKQHLLSLEKTLGVCDTSQTQQAVAKGNARRADLKHYSGAMLYYGGEWYWGVDRLCHLELRLMELGLDSESGQPPIIPRPMIELGPLVDDGRLTLEIYPSLRSPYTAIGFDQTVSMARALGINLSVRPILPMVMRGAPMTREKGKYILFDTGREGRAAGVQFGPCADPIGEPARRAYSLFGYAREQGKLVEFISSFLKCAWVDAVNMNNDKGMKIAVERAGLDWQHAKQIVGNTGWQEELETNRKAMYDMGLWGVPSYRLLDEEGSSLLALWGQDRLWLVSRKIQEHLKARKQ